MSKLKGSRLLRKLIPSANLIKTDAGSDWTVGTGTGSGWTIYLDTSSGLTIPWGIWRGYFDLAGWSREELSAVISGVGFQKAGRYSATMGGTVPVMDVYSMLTKAYIPDEAFNMPAHGLPLPALGYSYNPPGMILSNYNLEEVFGGTYECYAADTTTVPALRQTANEVWGAGDTTAGNKMYITVAINLSGQDQTSAFVTTPPMAVIVPTTIIEEKDLIYINRLRRSYVDASKRNP